MGKFARALDGAVLGLIAYAAAFLYFYHLTGSGAAAALLAAPLGALAAWGYGRRAGKKGARRERARRARAMVDGLALLPESEARDLALKYAGFTGLLVQRHPKGRPLDADDVLALWRGRGGEVLEIATTGRIEDGAWAAVEGLAAPRIALTDTAALARRFEESALPLPEPPRTRRRFRLRVPRKRAKHCALYGCAMLGVYLMTGLYTYLAASLTLLALTMLALRRPSPLPDSRG